jgi:hypothetical protein
MSCCGKKRQAMLSSSSAPAKKTSEREEERLDPFVESNSPQTTAIFRYTGSSSLEVDGIFKRRVYKFSRRMPELTVLAEDVSIMRGYNELIELRK